MSFFSLRFVLGVDVDQHLAQRAELADGHRLAVDVGAGATFRGNDPAQQALPVCIQLLVAQPPPRLG